MAATAAHPLRAQDFTWQAGPGARSASLAAPSNGKTGFTLLNASQTGVRFTNTLTEWEGASNRVLLNGSGVAAGDFDSDGRPDLYFCSLNGRNTLYKNLGGWRFADVTEQAGLKRDRRYYRGAVFADVNGDGSLDLLACVIGGGTLCFLNDGKGKFSDATAAARTASPFGSMTLALADVDGNGTLDLYVANNRTDDMRDRGQLNLRLVNGKMTVPPELQDRFVILDGQVQEYGEPDQLYLNNGQGRFTPVSWTGGRFRDEDGGPLAQPPLDWGLSAAFRDLNGDGFPDIYVCNDFWTPDRVWLNDGLGRFRAAPRLALRNMSASSMGVDFADIDRDGHVDFFVADMWSRDPRLRKRQKPAQNPMAPMPGRIDDRPQFMRNTLCRGRGDGTFAEVANFAGVAASEWSWSPVFLDVDLDGYEDLLITAGHAKDVQDLDALLQIRARQHPWTGFTNEVERQKAFTMELMEHMRLYPPLEAPVIAFRNRGGGRFEEATTTWGTDQPGVHHAIALADFDRDGDLDLVVNNLGSAAGVYRNDCPAPRVAVRLKGLPPNTQGIGARVKLLGGAAPSQSQEVVSGGRYMAGSDPMLAFAAGNTTNDLILEVTWRSGRQSRIMAVKPNRLYELDESAASPSRNTQHATRLTPLFADASALLNHRHHEEPFDDFARQPLQPFKRSQAGPGVAWFDLDGDGSSELFIGSGRGGTIAGYRVKGPNRFEAIPSSALPPLPDDATGLSGWVSSSGRRELLAGISGYESDGAPSVLRFEMAGGALVSAPPWPGTATGSGAMATADLDGDGDLDLIVGGTVMAGRYPEATPLRVYRCTGEQLELDSENTKVLAGLGLVNGIVWSDLDADGFAELILACEWGPVRIFRNERGRLLDWDAPIDWREPPATHHPPPTTLRQLTGLWTGLTTGDLDGDGRLDIIAANWGLNSEHRASREQPLQLYHGDLLDRGVVNLIETEWDPVSRAVAPRHRLDILSRDLPVLPERFATHKAYSEATLENVLGPMRTRARKAQAVTLASMVFLNRGGRFEAEPLPAEAQWAPAFGVCVADFDGDGREDAFLAQNFFALPAGTPRLDAGRGLVLRGCFGEAQGRRTAAAGAASPDDRAPSASPLPPLRPSPLLTPVAGQQSGLEVYGEQRGAAVADFDADGRTDLVVAQNGAATRLFRNTAGRAGLRVRLAGPPGNPAGVGAQIRLKFDQHLGPAREIHSGSGYWSQDDAVQVLGTPATPKALQVLWPGGKTTTVTVPQQAAELTVGPAGM
jgi:hypothetical protein